MHTTALHTTLLPCPLSSSAEILFHHLSSLGPNLISAQSMYGSILLLATHTDRQTYSWVDLGLMALVYLGCFINAHAQASAGGWDGYWMKGQGVVLREWPLDFLDSPGAWPWLPNTETGIPSVTRHWANKGRHSIDIEKYSRRIRRDESDPLCLSSAWYEGEIQTRWGKREKEHGRAQSWMFPVSQVSLSKLQEANFCFKAKTQSE